MKDAEHLNPVRYWRNTLADAARVDIPVDKVLSIRNAIVQLHGGSVAKQQAVEFIETKEQQLNEKKGLRTKTDPGWEILDEVPVLLAPFRVSPRPEFTRLSGETGVFYPFWVRAILTKTGSLRADEDTFPYIPRTHLEPQVNERVNFIFSDVDTIDLAFSRPYTGKQMWTEYWKYVEQTFRAITGMSIDTYSRENHTTTHEPTLVINETVSGAADGIIQLYNALIQGQSIPPLLKTLADRSAAPLKPLLTGKEFETVSAIHGGQMGFEFPLSLSQRKSLYHVTQLREGNILAVNGPPGTGKTTLLQSIVASEVVKHALVGKDPAVILACSTNNQAVTNIIDSFSNVKQKPGLLYKRWLPRLKGFGLYLPSESKDVDPSVLYLKRKKGGFHRDSENPDYLAEAEAYFINHFSLYASKTALPLAEIVSFLHTTLTAKQQQLSEGIRLWQEYQTTGTLLQQLRPLSLGPWPTDAQLSALETTLKALEEKVSTYLDNESIWLKLFSFLKPIKEKRATRLRQLFRDCPVDYQTVNTYDINTAHRFFDDKLGLIDKIRQLTKAWSAWKKANQISGNPPQSDAAFREAEQNRQPYFYDELEMGLKYDLFYLAVHYWEGRWILDTTKALKNNQLSKQGIDASQDRWRRFAMLTPCFVSTFYTAPRFFTYSKFVNKTASGSVFENPPLQGFIDLLIVDEAGQVSPEVGAATFALAKRAVVVGDTLQIEPVWNVPKKVDYANLIRHQLIRSIDDQTAIDDLLNKGFLSSSGSIMKLAQKASPYQLFPRAERGMLLTEHRRCFDEIINYCNTLAYKGLLEPKKGPARNQLFVPMQFIPTTGDSETTGSSRSNKQQASQLAAWLLSYRDAILHHYQQLENMTAQNENRSVRTVKLADLIGIITPFTGQKFVLRAALEAAGIHTTGLTIGTVHTLQGAERAIILFSSTYGDNDQGKSYFFDAGVNMLNVGVSRAKEAFIFFGSRSNFDQAGSTPSKQLYQHIQRVNPPVS